MKSKTVKREEAEARNEKWHALSVEERLEDLATRPGECKRETARLLKQVKRQ